MDWIDEKLEKLKRWIYHADLKKALIFYICIAVASAALATVLTAQICSSWIEVLLTPYSEIELIRGINQEGHPVFFHHKRTYQALPRSVTVAVMFLEALGIFFYGIGDNFPAAYMVPMLYYVANYGSGKKYLGKFFLFSMTAENSMDEKIWLFVGGSCLLILGIWWRTSGRRMIASGKVRIGERNQ